MFSKLDRLLWSFFTFLWRYMTLPGLLALFTICLMQLHRRVPSYYIAWNSSMVRSPYPGLSPPLRAPFISSPTPRRPEVWAPSIPREPLASFPVPGEWNPQHRRD